MTDQISGRGDPVKLLQLMWGKDQPPRRGPKPRARLTEILGAAIAIADAEGMDAVSTRRVAEAAGISPMSFYTYIPSKAELYDLMLDQVLSEAASPPDGWSEMDWRARLELVAESMWNFYLRHPWVVQFQTHRPVLGPNTLASYEIALSAVDGIGLDDIEMDLAITSFSNYILGAVRDAARAKTVKDLSGMSDNEWWERIEPFLVSLVDWDYPIASRVGPVVGAEYGLGDPERAFRFGLARFLDGLEMMVAGKQSAGK